MTRLLSLRNRQRRRAVDTPLLRRLALQLLHEEFRLPEYELAVHLVAAPEMSRLNESYLQHRGSTDVITFDYADKEFRVPGFGFRVDTAAALPKAPLHGEIFICLDDATVQARQFGTSWQSELVRYLVHGLLHLRGFDDRLIASRRRMKREENRLVRHLARRFPLVQLARDHARRRTSPAAT